MDEMDPEAEWRQQRGRLVGLTLAGLLVGGVMSFFFLVCGGYAIYAALVVLAFTAMGCLHYVLWGRRLSEEMAEERRAEELRRRLEEEAWPTDEDEPHRFRRF
jgi:hypothetical protein